MKDVLELTLFSRRASGGGHWAGAVRALGLHRGSSVAPCPVEGGEGGGREGRGGRGGGGGRRDERTWREVNKRERREGRKSQ